MNRKPGSKIDTLLKRILQHGNLSLEAIEVLDGGYYAEKMKERLLRRGYIKKTNIKATSKSAIKSGVSYKTQSYYVTLKGRKYLLGKFPTEYDESILKPRRQNNSIIERVVKMGDSDIMAEMSGVHIVDSTSPFYEDIGSEANGEDAVNNFLHNNTSKASGIKKSDLINEAVEENLSQGIYFNAFESKKSIILLKDDISQYNFTSLVGTLLTSSNPYFLYHASNGFLSQTKKGERLITTSLLKKYMQKYGLYPNELSEADSASAIIFCKSIGAFSKLYLNRYNVDPAPGEIFEKAHIVPVSRNGCNMLKKFIRVPGYKNTLVDILVDDYGFERNTGVAKNIFPLVTQNGEAIYIGTDFEINSFRTAKALILENTNPSYDEMVVFCYEWQQEYYNEVVALLNTKKITCQPIDEDVLDEVIGFADKIPVGKQRKRRQPLYTNNVMFLKERK